jgi:hypothetical protein
MLAVVADLLHARGNFAVGRGRVPWLQLGLLLALFGFAYGAVMGSYGLRAEQALYSGIKVPLFLGGATLVCLPNFFVVNTLLGLREDFTAACRGILASQATIAVALAAQAPFVALAYASSDNYRWAIVINGAWFALASLAGQMTLARHYGPLVARNQRHRTGRTAWLVLYVFVAIQLAWMLRPFVGAPAMETTFLRQGPLTNAYVVVAKDVWLLLTGR